MAALEQTAAVRPVGAERLVRPRSSRSASALNDRSAQRPASRPRKRRASLQGRIQPFRPGGTFEAFGRTARDIGQSTPFRPKQDSEGLLTECHHRGRAAAKTAHKPSLCPRGAQV